MPDSETKTKTIRLPAELHGKITRIAGYGNAEALIIECLEEAIGPRYQRWLKQELAKESSSPKTKKGMQ